MMTPLFSLRRISGHEALMMLSTWFFWRALARGTRGAA
jgi:hypothetical protein